MKRTIIALLILFSCAGCRQKGRDHVLLRLNYQKGDVFDIRYQTYMTIDNDAETIKNEYTRMTFRIDSVYKNGQYQLSAKYVYVRVDNGWPTPEQYSSDKEEAFMAPRELAIHSLFKTIKDSVFTLTIDSRGKLIKPMAFANGTPLPANLAPINYETCQIVFPQDSVVTGDAWTNERIEPLSKDKRTYTFILYSIKEAVMVIGVKGEFEQASSGESHSFTGEYIIDKDSKNLVSANLNMQGNTLTRGKVKVDIVINGPR